MITFRMLVVCITLFSPIAAGAQTDTAGFGDFTHAATVGEIEQSLRAAGRLYRQGEHGRAKSSASAAYFDIFEGRGLEAWIAAKDPRFKAEIEALFAQLISAIRAGRPADEIDAGIDRTLAGLYSIPTRLASRPPTAWMSFANSFLIIVREGAEAILILSALIAYLTKTGHADKVRVIYGGGAWALVAGAATAVAVNAAVSGGGQSREITEGFTMLLAAAVLFYVSYWLTSKAQVEQWRNFIQGSVDRSISRGSLFALGAGAFLAVYREAAETILFYQALTADDAVRMHAVWSGFLAGCAVLVGLFFLFRYGSMRLPVGLFFTGTGIFLYYLAVKFTGDGVAELQAGGVLNVTAVSGLPVIRFLGFNPTLESLIAQGTLIFLAAVALLHIIYGARQRAGFTPATRG